MRPYGNILMGKKTRMRKAIRGMLDKNPSLEQLLPHIQQNVGFVFAKNDLNEGEKVGASEATLLNMLNISPFSYGLVIEKVY